jgi:ribonuclease VapC
MPERTPAIVADTSAIMAILYDEPEAAKMRQALHAAKSALISAANVLELQLVIAGARSRTGWQQAADLLRQYNIAIHPFDERQLHLAREAALKYGKGRHKAKLNFGDCFAYALAKSEGVPLLCTGRDFAHTDLEMA